MNILQAILLGLVQGLTEFLPVSSSGHLVLFQHLMNIESAAPILFEVLVHVGTLFAVCLIYWKDIWYMITHPFSRLVQYLVVATIPAVVVTLLFGDFIESAFSGTFLGIGFLFTALVLGCCWYFSGRRGRRFREMGFQDSILMGMMQAIAILPGVSRSGSTLTGGTLSGLHRSLALKFGFLMSIPAILGSLLFKLKDLITLGAGGIGFFPVTVAMLVSAVSGFLAIKFMIALVNQNKLWVFAVYVAVLGVYVILDQSFFHLIF